MTSATSPYAGGCQCGAVRFRVERVGRASICHCRMCQKAFGSFYGAFVNGHGVAWTRGTPKYFASSNLVRRGFCGECGTPLTIENGGLWLAIGAFDNPLLVAPISQVNPADKQPFTDGLAALPTRQDGDAPEWDSRRAQIISYQHPDHDTAEWPPKA